MTDAPNHPRHPTVEPDDPRLPETKPMTRNVPPLVWVIGALFVGWFAFMAIGPAIDPGRPADAVMPAQPASGSAPATPPSTGNP